MTHLTDSITIDRPARVVADAVHDWSHDVHWRPAVLRITTDPAGRAHVGQRITEHLRLAGTTFVTPTRIDSVHPERVLWSGGDRRLRISGGRDVRAIGEGRTRVTLHLDVEMHGPMRLASPVLTALYRRVVRDDLRCLQRWLEDPDGGTERVAAPHTAVAR